MGKKGPLGLDDRRHAGARRRKHGKEPVALGTHFPPVVSGDAGPDEAMVNGEHFGVGVVTETAEQRRRAFDVGEEESKCLRERRVRGCQDRCT